MREFKNLIISFILIGSCYTVQSFAISCFPPPRPPNCMNSDWGEEKNNQALTQCFRQLNEYMNELISYASCIKENAEEMTTSYTQAQNDRITALEKRMTKKVETLESKIKALSKK